MNEETEYDLTDKNSISGNTQVCGRYMEKLIVLNGFIHYEAL